MSRLNALRAGLRSIARLEQSLAGVRAATEQLTGRVADLTAAVDRDRIASEAAYAQLVDYLMQFQRDNWDAATRRHEYTVAIIESFNRRGVGLWFHHSSASVVN